MTFKQFDDLIFDGLQSLRELGRVPTEADILQVAESLKVEGADWTKAGDAIVECMRIAVEYGHV